MAAITVLLTTLVGIVASTSPTGYDYPCIVDGEKVYWHGDTYEKDCNVCSCGIFGRISCTEMACEPTTGPSEKASCAHNGKEHADGSAFDDDCNRCFCNNGEIGCTIMDCTEMKNECRYHGAIYEHGSTFDEDCNQCHCNNGVVDCSYMECPPKSDKYLCEYKGVVYEHGETFKEDCNTCDCDNGIVGCTLMACETKQKVHADSTQ